MPLTRGLSGPLQSIKSINQTILGGLSSGTTASLLLLGPPETVSWFPASSQEKISWAAVSWEDDEMWSTILLMSRLPTVDSLKATGVREIYQRLAGAGAEIRYSTRQDSRVALRHQRHVVRLCDRCCAVWGNNESVIVMCCSQRVFVKLRQLSTHPNQTNW